MMEVMIVVGIIAILAAIAIPSIISINRSTKFTQRNNYAKAVYMAAQSHLMDLRSSSSLESVTPPANHECAVVPQTGTEDNPAEGYIYACHDDSHQIGEPGYYYNTVLPLDSVEDTVRNQQVIIEYNPNNGSVYAVFFYEGKDNLVDLYRAGVLYRDSNDNDRKERKKLQVGYYQSTGADLGTEEDLSITRVASQLEFLDGEIASLQVKIPLQNNANQDIFTSSNYMELIKGLKLTLSATGDTRGSFAQVIPLWKEASDANAEGPADGVTIERDVTGVPCAVITFPVDSLTAGFERFMQDAQSMIPLGDNVTFRVEAEYEPMATVDGKETILLIDGASVTGVNPLFQAMTRDPERGTYTLAVANGRHLQNLDKLDAELAAQIRTVTLVPEQDASGKQVIDWSATVAAYESGAVASFRPIDGTVFGERQKEQRVTIQGNGVTIRGLSILGEGEQDRLGLFGTLTDAVVSNLTVEAPVIVGEKSYAAGVLAGQTKDVTVTDCSVLQNEAKTGAVSNVTNAGGLVGYAAESEFENCVAELPVSGIAGADSWVGGVVGCATDCTFRNVEITMNSLPAAGKCAGGLAGFMEKSTVSAVTVNVKKDTTAAISGLLSFGGLAGEATDCVLGVDGDNNSIRINMDMLPDRTEALADENLRVNVGGLTGVVSDSEITNVEIHLTGAAEITETKVNHFGGVSGAASRSTVEKTEVYLSGKFVADDLAAGAVAYAMNCGLSQVNILLEDQSDTTKGAEIYANSAAGLVALFQKNDNGTYTISTCDVGLFDVDGSDKWDNSKWEKMQYKLSIRGITQAAGFVVENQGVIRYSRVLASVETVQNGQNVMTGGFVAGNKGIVEYCMANVAMSKGCGFVANNYPAAKVQAPNGTIRYCYGWVYDNANGRNSVLLAVSGEIKSSYFGYVLPHEDTPENKDKVQVVLYPMNPEVDEASKDKKVADEITTTDALTDEFAMELLDPNKQTWKLEKNPGATKYPYPALISINHKGLWPAPSEGNYGYGILYYEQYADGTWGVSLTDLNADEKIGTASSLKNDKEFASVTGQDALPITGYAIFCRTGKQTDAALALTGAKLEGSYDFTGEKAGSANYKITDKLFEAAGLTPLYTIYPLVELDSNTTGTAKVGTTTLNLRYGNTVGKSNDFELRAASHFSAIPENSDRNFVFTRSMTLGNHTVKGYTGTLSAASGVEITISQPLVNAASTGTLKNLTVTAVGSAQLVEWVTSVADATHYGASEIPAGEITTLDGLTAIGSTPPKLTNVTIENCKLNDAAVNTRSAYFYKVSEEKYKVGTAVDPMQSVTVTAVNLDNAVGLDAGYVSTAYFRKTDSGYERLFVEKKTGSETGHYVFNIKFGSSTAADFQSYNMAPDSQLDETYYIINLPTYGVFQIKSGTKVLTSTGWVENATGSTAFWTLSGTTLTNVGDPTVTKTLSAASGDTITNPVLVNDEAAELYNGSVYYEIKPVTAPKYMLAA